MILLLIAVGVLLTIAIATFFILRWHDRIKEETRQRAIEGGCPFFASIKNEDSQ